MLAEPIYFDMEYEAFHQVLEFEDCTIGIKNCAEPKMDEIFSATTCYLLLISFH